MSTVPNYPLPFDPSDNRLTDQLVELVADLLAEPANGFPFIGGPDLQRLRDALHQFLYGLADMTEQGLVGETPVEAQCPPECRQNWTRASDPLVHVAHCPKFSMTEGGAR